MQWSNCYIGLISGNIQTFCIVHTIQIVINDIQKSAGSLSRKCKYCKAVIFLKYAAFDFLGQVMVTCCSYMCCLANSDPVHRRTCLVENLSLLENRFKNGCLVIAYRFFVVERV